jgi:hypothetical protein
MVPVLVPPATTNCTARPPLPSSFPMASAVTSVNVAWAPATTVRGSTVTDDVMGETGPGTTSIVGSGWVTGSPSTVAPIVVGVPAATPVKLAL